MVLYSVVELEPQLVYEVSAPAPCQTKLVYIKIIIHIK
jgi:hypothetical protein